MDFLTQSPHFYDYVTYGVLALGLFNAFEIVSLIHNKSKVERSEQRRLELKRLASTALVTATAPAELLPKPVTEDDFAAYSEAIASVLDSFEGEIAEKAKALLDQLGIAAHYRNLARDRTWYKRGNAVDILSSFHIKSNREFFLARFRSEPHREVKYRIVYGLSRLARDHGDITALAHMLSTLPYLTAKYTEDIFYNIITALKVVHREDEFGVFMRDLLHDKGVPALVKRDVLTACFAASCEKGRPLLKQYYETYPDEPEVLIAALRALARIGDFSHIPEALKNPHWLVRMTALKSADLCCMAMLPEIRGMLKDSNYHVRLAAALTLARGGEKGRAVLQEVKVSEDKFAAEAAAYALTQEAR